VFTMFFVWCSALATLAYGMNVANGQNLPVLSYSATVTGTPFMAYIAPIVVTCAISSTYFEHSVGTVEGTKYLVGLVAPSTNDVPSRKMDLWTYLFIFVVTSLVAVVNPSILDMISVVGGIFFALMTYLLPMYAIYK